jgi:hypothetical protein
VAEVPNNPSALALARIYLARRTKEQDQLRRDAESGSDGHMRGLGKKVPKRRKSISEPSHATAADLPLRISSRRR